MQVHRISAEDDSARETDIRSALRSGDVRRAVELLLEGYQEELYAYCVRLVGAHDAPRVYHRVLLTSVAEIASLGEHASSRAWLYGKARQAVAHHQSANPQAFTAASTDGYAPADGPEHDLQGRSRDEDLARALEALSASAREVLQLALWHGLRLAEIAAVTGRSVAQVRTLAAEALAYLSLQRRGAEEAPS